MAHPARNAFAERILSNARVFFATTRTHQGLRIFRVERNAMLLIEVLRSNQAAGRFELHDFVIMPDHLHLLMTLPGDISVEKSMQLIKGGFSYRVKKELGYRGEVWQRGFSDARIRDQESFSKHCEYILQNPVRARLVDVPEDYPYGFTQLAKKKAQRLKPNSYLTVNGPTKVVP
jgi:putative transposase